MSVASGIAGSSLITAMGGNGVEVGLQIAGLPGQWFTAPASPPNGQIAENIDSARRLGAIGDSAVVEALGLGAMNITQSPEQMKALGAFAPADFEQRIEVLRLGPHLDFNTAAPPIGITAREVVAYSAGPMVALGIIDREGELGRIGGGIFDPPIEMFTAAMSALNGR